MTAIRGATTSAVNKVRNSEASHHWCRVQNDGTVCSLSVTALGAAYLGGRSLAEFAVTGEVRELSPGALATASAAFGWPVAPASIEVF